MNLTIYRTKNGTIITPYRKGLLWNLETSTSTYDHVYHKKIEETGFFVNNFRGSTAFVTHGLPFEAFSDLASKGYSIVDMPTNMPNEIESDFALKQEVQLRDYQGDVILDIMNSRKRYSEWFINLQTDLGKTVIGIELIHQFHKKAMVVCFRNVILEQWQEKLLDKTTADPERIHFISGSAELEKMYSGEFDSDFYDIYLVNPNTLTNYFRKYDYAKMYHIFNNLGIGTLIFDEAHRNMGLAVKLNATTNVQYTIYLSADYGQGERNREMKYYSIFRNTKIIKLDQEVADSFKHTKIIVVDYDTNPSQNEMISINNRYGYSADNYMKYQFKKGRILEVIRHLVESIIESRKPEYRTLIFFTNQWAVDECHEYLTEYFKGKKIKFGRYHGAVNDKEKNTAKLKADFLIATYSSLNTGLDQKNFKYIIGTNQSNKIEDNQTAGRGRPMPDGTDNIYMMLVDSGFPYCKKKLKTRLGYLQEQKSKDKPTYYRM